MSISSSVNANATNKKWINLNCNSVNSDSVSVHKLLNTGSFIVSDGSGSYTPTAEQIIGGTLAVSTTGSPTVQIPSVAEINAVLPATPQDLSFEYKVFFTSNAPDTNSIKLLLPTGITADTVTPDIVKLVQNQASSRVFTFHRDSPTTFKVYA